MANIWTKALTGIAGTPRAIADTTTNVGNALGLPPYIAKDINTANPITTLGQYMPSSQELDSSFDNAATNWAPTPLASILANALTPPPRRDVADTLGAPVDGMSYLLHRLTGLNVPTTTPSSSTHTYQPAANVPFSSEFFNNLLGDAGALSAGSSQYLNDHPPINALARTLLRPR
jgi:hypothetical protein